MTLSTLSLHTTLNKMNSSAATMSATSTLPYGLGLSYEDHVSAHSPSGEWNHIVARIILDQRSGRALQRLSSETLYDVAVCTLEQSIKKATEEEERLVSLSQKIKEELKNFTISASDESAGHDNSEEDEEEESPDYSGPGLSGPREKMGSDPKWLQSLKGKKEQQQQALKRKSLLSSLKSQENALAEIRKTLADERSQLLKQKGLQELSIKLQKAIYGAEKSYRQTLDQDYLIKNIHYNMELWSKRSAPLLPPPRMIQRLVGSPGSFKTIMVSENQRPIIPLEEYIREDW